MPGSEVIQVYVQAPETENIKGNYRSIKDLKQFAKVFLKPQETKQVEMTLAPKAFSYWNSDKQKWMVEPGTYTIYVGTSLEDIKHQQAFDISN